MAALRHAGFHLDHHTGGHAIFYKQGYPNPVTVPDHPGDLKTGTLRRIIKDAGLSVDEFIRFL
jgi:predicted RNA binding protein YcfA (HicA-like mRNA interferase family)